MKFLALFLSLTFSTMAFSNSTVESVELKPDLRIPINTAIDINSYNLHAEGPCGEYDIIGMIALPPVNDPNVEVGESTLIELVTKVVSENLE